MARYAEWNKFIGNLKTDTWGETNVNEVGIAFEKATADVVPKKEIVDALYDLKHKIHDKAVRPNNAGIDAYISLKVFDAIIQDYLNKIMG